MTTFIGIDPGGRNVGIIVRDGNQVLHSTTYYRPDDSAPVEWAVNVQKRAHEEIISKYPNAKIGIENVTKPNSHHQGQQKMLNPKFAIDLALVVGSFANAYPDAVIVRPGKNGSQPVDTYPVELQGRRPKTLPGVNEAKTRNHERSAWDVSVTAETLHRENKKLDSTNVEGIFG